VLSSRVGALGASADTRAFKLTAGASGAKASWMSTVAIESQQGRAGVNLGVDGSKELSHLRRVRRSHHCLHLHTSSTASGVPASTWSPALTWTARALPVR